VGDRQGLTAAEDKVTRINHSPGFKYTQSNGLAIVGVVLGSDGAARLSSPKSSPLPDGLGPKRLTPTFEILRLTDKPLRSTRRMPETATTRRKQHSYCTIQKILEPLHGIMHSHAE
jgi:hypothetical protein